MKKILFIIAFLFTVFANAQGGPKVDVVKFRGEVTTTVRNTFDVPTGERWLIWNVTTSQFEHAGSDDVWSALDTTGTDDQNATEVNIVDSGGNYTGTTVEAALVEIATQFTAQSDDQTASEVNITDLGNNYTGTTVEAALSEVADSIAVKANLADVINWNPVPSGGSNKILSNTADEIKASNVTVSASGGVDFISSLGTIGLTPTDSPPFTAKGWIYMDDSESRLKVGDGSTLRNLAYENEVLKTNFNNIITSFTGIGTSTGPAVTFSTTSDVLNLRGGDTGALNSVQLILDNNSITIGGYTESEMNSVGDASIVSKKYVDDAISSASLPSTLQQYYIVGASAKDTISDADYSAAAEYKSLFYRNIDTLEAGDGVTFATHGNKPIMVQPTTKDSTYIKKADGVDFFVAGQKAAISGDGLIVKNRNTAVGYKEGADAWYWSGDLTVHTEVTAIEAFGFDYDFNANGLSLGALSSWTNSGGGVGTEAAQATGTDQPTVIDESGIRAVQFDGTNDHLELGTQSDLNPTIGTDSGTIIVVVGADNGTTGTWFSDRDAVRNINTGITSATQVLVQVGEGAQVFDNISPSGAYIYEISFDATTIDTFLNGSAELSGDTTIGSNQAQQPWFIGSRAGGTYFDGSIRRILVKFGAQLTPAERTAIVAQLTSENL